MMAFIAEALALIAQAQAAPAAAPPRWGLQADPALCVLERRIDDAAATLSVRTIPGSDSYRVSIAVPGIGKPRSFVPAVLTFAPVQSAFDGPANIANLPDGRQLLWMDGIAPAMLDRLASADAVTITTRSGARGTVALAAPARAVAAMRRCVADQLIEWGADAGQFAPGGTMPVAVRDRDDWLSKRDLLAIVGQSKASDVDALFRVGISGDGMIDDCHAVGDAIGTGVEKIACAAVLNKPLFTPARDAGGRAIRGVATFQVILASRPAL